MHSLEVAISSGLNSMYVFLIKEKPIAVINRLTLRDTDFNLSMLCLFEGGLVSKDITYEKQL